MSTRSVSSLSGADRRRWGGSTTGRARRVRYLSRLQCGRPVPIRLMPDCLFWMRPRTTSPLFAGCNNTGVIQEVLRVAVGTAPTSRLRIGWGLGQAKARNSTATVTGGSHFNCATTSRLAKPRKVVSNSHCTSRRFRTIPRLPCCVMLAPVRRWMGIVSGAAVSAAASPTRSTLQLGGFGGTGARLRSVD
jgi:hypothetical protein